MDWRRVVAYSATYSFWGASFLAIREIVVVAPPFLSAGIRFTVAGLVLFLWMRLRGAPRATVRQWGSCAMLGLIMFSINYACLFWAEQRVASGYAAIISATIPVWIFIGEWLILGAVTPTAGAVGGILGGLAGITLLVLPGSGHGRIDPAAFALLLGALCWASGVLWSRRLDIPKSPFEGAALQMGLGGLMLLGFSAAIGEPGRLGAVAAAWTWRLTIDMGYLILCASIAAFTAFLYLMNHEPASRVASCSYVNPLVAVIIGAEIGGERLKPLQAVGAALVICGVFFTLRGKMPVQKDGAGRELKLAASRKAGD
jgi:drug/metabolite transporter (DMT)-like permease